jgi:hypothetical protein
MMGDSVRHAPRDIPQGLLKRASEPEEKQQVSPLRYAPVGGCDFFDFFHNFGGWKAKNSIC